MNEILLSLILFLVCATYLILLIVLAICSKSKQWKQFLAIFIDVGKIIYPIALAMWLLFVFIYAILINYL